MRVCPTCQSVYTSRLDWCVVDRTQLVDQSQDPLIGKEIERYQILEAIGTGGLGRVYRAQHAFIERSYAIKVLFGDYSADPKFQERFRREANSASKIRHPNVVRVEDFGTSRGGLTFLAMELLRGETLDAAIQRQKLPPERAAHVARQVLAGLGAAHDLGFVHRDVKPQNIMLMETDQGEQVKILDFGTVAMRKEPPDQRITGIGDLIGTPTYMAPEQCRDAGVGPAADLYAVGVLLFEMLTGAPPFDTKGRAETLMMQMMVPPPPAPPSSGLEKVVAALLRKEPGDRPASASAVIAMIDELELDLGPTGDLEPPIAPSEIQLLGRSDSDEFESKTVKDQLDQPDHPTPEIVEMEHDFDDATVPPSIETARTKELDLKQLKDPHQHAVKRWLASLRAWFGRG